LGAGASESGRQNTVFLKSQFFGGGGWGEEEEEKKYF
jgi:hypothetical protein